MDKCPFTGKPCSNAKVIHITEVKDLKEVETIHCCQACEQGALKPKAKETSSIGKHAMTLFEILQALIHNKFSTSPSQIVFTNFNPQSLAITKPPCPECGASLRDIAAAQRMGCPGCYTHYSKELLPVLAHAHKSCEHVGKIPKNRPMSKQDQIKTMELKLKQAIEFEKYEQAREIKTALDALKNQ